MIARGFQVFRNKKEWYGQSDRITKIINDSNANGVDVHVALHTNAPAKAEDTHIRGITAYHKTDDGGKGEDLANKIIDQIMKIAPNIPGWRRSLLGNGGVGETTRVNAPSALIEYCSHTNAEDVKWLRDNMSGIADKTIAGIVD